MPLLLENDQANLEIEGRVAADQITPYPPGIPVLVPGQLITTEIIHYLVGLLRSPKKIEMHGILYEGYLPCVRVLQATEESGLRPLVH